MSEDVVHYWPNGRQLSACGVNMFTTAYTFGASGWADVTCGPCKLEQPAQKVPGRVEYKIPEEVRHLDALLAAADKRVIAARKVVKWTARLNAALAEERRLTDAPVPLWPAPAEVTLNELHAATEARSAQLKPFVRRMRELLSAHGPLKARQAALDEAHEQALQECGCHEPARLMSNHGKPMPY